MSNAKALDKDEQIYMLSCLTAVAVGCITANYNDNYPFVIGVAMLGGLVGFYIHTAIYGLFEFCRWVKEE